jgi:tight adherence protein B
MNATLLTAIVIFAAVTLGTLSLALAVEWFRERRLAGSVLKQLRGFADQLDARGSAVMKQRAQQDWVSSLQRRFPSFRDLAIMMDRGKTEWGVGPFLLASAGLGIGLGLLVGMGMQTLPGGIVASVMGASMPYLVVRRRATKRMDKFEEQLPDAIDLMTRAIRAGHPLNAGFQMVADEASEPTAGEFRRVFEEQRFGLPFEDAIYGLADRVPLVDTRIMATAMLVQREVGGNLAEVLGNLAHVIRERFKIRRQLRVITAQGRMSGYVLAALPLCVGAAIYLLNREYSTLLFTHPLGKIMLVVAVVMQVIGYLWIRKIVNIEI